MVGRTCFRKGRQHNENQNFTEGWLSVVLVEGSFNYQLYRSEQVPVLRYCCEAKHKITICESLDETCVVCIRCVDLSRYVSHLKRRLIYHMFAASEATRQYQ